SPLTTLQERLPDAIVAVEGLLQAPYALGVNGAPQTYLIVLQNEDELRPTGGFISAIGEARFVQGRLESLNFEDSYVVDNFSAPLISPPPSLNEIMLAERWLLRDANWSPDGTTTFNTIQSIYENQTGRTIDGVIMLNQEAVVRLVEALEPLTLPNAPEPITGANLRAYMREAYSADSPDLEAWWGNRKAFIQTLFDAIVA